MLGKIVYYEFRDTYKPICTSYIIFFFAILLHVVGLGRGNGGNVGDIIGGLLYFSSMIILATILLVGQFIFSLNRYKKTMYGAQGYLTHTLPAEEWQLYFGKLLGSIFWTFISGLLVSIMILLSVYLENDLSNFTESYYKTIHEIANTDGLALSILGIFLYFAYLYSFFFLCMAIGQLSNNKKTLITILAVIGLSICTSIIKDNIFDSFDLGFMLYFSDMNFRESTFFVTYYGVMTLLFSAVTIHLNSHKLNLE